MSDLPLALAPTRRDRIGRGQLGTSISLWLGFIALIGGLLALDLGLLHRRGREIKVAEALGLSLFYFILAMLFCGGVFHFRGSQAGYEFLAGYLIEWSLSIDNIFVFVLVFAYFGVPAQYQHRVLFWGVIGALIMRGLLIFAGSHLIQAFHWVVFVFGAFLIVTAIKMLVMSAAKPDIENNVVVRTVRRYLRVTTDYDGKRFFTHREGLLWATPLFLVLVVIEFTDLVFAVDSIPAIFAVTLDPFVVYTSNAFAILGLRSLYFALAHVVHRFHYLKYGLAIVLAMVGTKMIVNGAFEEKVIPTEFTLAATAVLVFGSIALSLLRPHPAPEPLSGWVPGDRRKREQQSLSMKEAKR
jgi:tellurite resistance protein TerC